MVFFWLNDNTIIVAAVRSNFSITITYATVNSVSIYNITNAVSVIPISVFIIPLFHVLSILRSKNLHAKSRCNTQDYYQNLP